MRIFHVLWLVSVAAAAFACGSSGSSSDGSPPGDDSTPSDVPPGGDDAGSDAKRTTPPPAPPPNPPPPPPPPPGVGGAATVCSISDALPAAIVGHARLAVSVEAGQTILYVAVDDDGSFGATTPIRRYVYGGASGCVLTRDATFGTAGVVRAQLGMQLFADTSGGLWTASTDGSFTGVLRVYPTAMSCTIDAALAGKFPEALTVDPTGTSGFVVYDSAPSMGVFGKLTATPTTCAVAPFTLTNAPVGESSVARAALDATGRLHTIQSAGTTFSIYGADGAFVADYDGDPNHAYALDVARCKTGMCVVKQDPVRESTLTSCDANGASCTVHLLPFEAQFFGGEIASTAGAPAFMIHVADMDAGYAVEIVSVP